MTNNVFITGGSRGIGAAAVLAFARAGYNVAFTYNSHPDAADAVRRQAEEINPGGLYLAIRADAGDPAQVRAAVARAEQGHARNFKYEELNPAYFIKSQSGAPIHYLKGLQLDLQERED